MSLRKGFHPYALLIVVFKLNADAKFITIEPVVGHNRTVRSAK